MSCESLASYELPLGWTRAHLSNLVEILDGKRIPVNSEERNKRTDGKLKGDLFPYYGATGQVGHIDDYIFDEELVLLGEDGVAFLDPLKHKSYKVNGKCWVNNHAHVLRAIEVIFDSRLLSHYLNQFDYSGFVSGTTRLKLTQGAMAKIPVLVPPRNEQKRIADKLDALLQRVAACRTRLEQVPDLMKQFRKSVFAIAIAGRLTEDWRGSPSTDSWLSGRLIDFIEEKPRNGYSPKAVGYPTAIKTLTLSATTTGQFKADCFKFVDEDIDLDSYLWLSDGDILIQRANTIEYVGVSAIYSGPSKAFIYPDLMMRCRAREGVLPQYLYYALSSEAVRNYFRDNATGTSGNMPKINQAVVSNAPVRLPPLKEQIEIVRRVESLLEAGRAVEKGLADAGLICRQLTPSLLAKAFSGELVPQDPNDEPASELLARIQQTSSAGHRIKKRTSSKKETVLTK